MANKQLAIFAFGGGGAWLKQPGSSGFFKYQTLSNLSRCGTVQLEIIIGAGGSSSSSSTVNGGSTTVSMDGMQVITANGGGGAGGPGWSGVRSGRYGGYNGQYGTGERLPTLCGGVTLAPGKAGYKKYRSTGAGGVIVDGMKPNRTSKSDGEGYGAGGGRYGKTGYNGVVVITLCDTTATHTSG